MLRGLLEGIRLVELASMILVPGGGRRDGGLRRHALFARERTGRGAKVTTSLLGLRPEFDHPRFGPLRTVDSPITAAGIDKRRPQPAPEQGQHTAEVLAELGYSKEEIADFLARGIAT